MYVFISKKEQCDLTVSVTTFNTLYVLITYMQIRKESILKTYKRVTQKPC